MSKKKNTNTNVEQNIDQSVENVEAVETAEAPVEDAVSEEAPVVEEVKEEVPTEDVVAEEAPVEAVEETPSEEKVDEHTAEEVEEETSVDEAPAVEEVKEAPVVEEPAPDVSGIKITTDGEDAGPVDYFVQLNKEAFTDEKLKMVEERLAKYSLSYFVSAEGIVFVGPYVTKDGAINGRRLVIRCGLKGEIVEIPKDNV